MNKVKTISIEIVRPVYLSGRLEQPGKQLELPDAVGRELIAMGKAVPVIEMRAAPAEQDEAPAERKAGKRA